MFRNVIDTFLLHLNMRISEEEIEIIKKLANKYFGQNTKVFLFGSRTFDNKRGGDIDLFITSLQKSNLTMAAKIEFLTELKYLIGDQKIDVILDTDFLKRKKQFYRSVTREAVEL
jgi:uncharacterized protein